MFHAFRVLFKNQELLVATVRQQLQEKFIGSVLGIVWFLLYPIFFLTLYALVFGFVLKIRIPGLSTPQYILTIFCGLVPFLAFSEAFSRSSMSIVSNRSLLKNTLFPIEMVVARDVLTSYLTLGTGIILIFIVTAINGKLYWTQLAIPLIYCLQIFLSLGLAWIISTLMVFFRDLQQAIPIFMLMLMLVSPIGYTEAMIPKRLHIIYILNPIAWLMNLYRECMINGNLPFIELATLAIFSMLIFILGYYFISQIKEVLIEYV